MENIVSLEHKGDPVVVEIRKVQKMEELQFVEDQEVEITWEEEHLKDAWFLAKILQATPITRSRMNDKRLIEYRTLGDNKKRHEYVHVSRLRPLPPQGKTGSLFKINEVVDVYEIGVWWKGVITEILESSRCKVCLSNSNETLEFGMEDLRIHRDWINGRWDPPVEEHGQETLVIKENQDELDSPIPTESTVLPMKACFVRRASIGSCTSEEEQHDITTPVPEGNRKKSLPSLPLLMKEPLGDIDIKKHRKVQSGQKKDCVLGKKRPAAKDSSRKTPGKGIKLQKSDLEKPEDLFVGIKLQKSDKEKPEDLAMGVNLITKGVSHENQFMETVIINGQASSPENLGLENLLASAECPNSLDRQTVLEQYHKTEDEQNETVPHYLSVISRTSPPCQEMNIALYPLQKDENVIPRSSPFVKSLPLSPLWECVDSMKALKSIRQEPHFRGLGKYSEKLREGMALGCMASFASLVEETRTTSLDEPQSSLQAKLEALNDLEELGFTVDPIRSRLQEMIKIKDEYKKLEDDWKAAEKQISKEKDENLRLEAQMHEIQMQIDELQKTITELNMRLQSVMVENEIKGSTVADLERKIDEYGQSILALRLDFHRVVAAPW